MNLEKFLEQRKDEFLKDFGVNFENLSDNDKDEIVSSMMEHLHKVIIETVIVNLSSEQLGELKNIIDLDGPEMESKIGELTSVVTGLAEKIESAVNHELNVLKQGYAMMK
jgi:hypothetical protein